MMDFLRRLAPPREADGSRAVAALPSRFAAGGPLRGPIRSPGPPEPLESPLEVSAPHPEADLTDRRSAPFSKGARGDAPAAAADGGAFPVLGSLFREALSTGEVAPAPAPSDGDSPSGRGERPSTASPLLSLASSAGREERRSAAPTSLVGSAAPLSAAILAHRAATVADETTVVHVSIGRIEVVANVAAPPPTRRVPPTRQPSVALADYLRGEPGGRR